MVVQRKDNKTPSSLIDLLGGSSKGKNTKANDAFAQLLSSLNTPVKSEKSFEVVVDAKNTKPSDTLKINTKVLESLVVNEEKKALPKELVDALSNDQVHSLIYKAKEYLKNSIEQKAPEYKTEGKTVPKTLMGLVELADKMGIDMSEITLSTLDNKEKPLFKGVSDSLLSKCVIEVKEPSKIEASTNSKTFEAIVGLIAEAKMSHAEPKSVKESDKTTAQPLQALLKGMDTAVSVAEVAKEIPKEMPKSLAGVNLDILGTLLRGNEVEKTEEKVGGKSPEEPVKTLHAHKADSLEVKSKEAVQSMRHFAIDLKEAAESYKPPFTRVTMKLNPEKLGEVEVTLVQRGNNVHVNIQSSNSNSVAFLAHNATELKAQLAGQGIPNATMNFMSGGENQQQNQNSQQQQQQPNRFQSYQSLQELESNEEQLSALEIILPHYA
ncbi:MAG: flagellar hook-length control protein FliK [Sulfuricurvum sp.]|nr:flagellar hook-length control protein FliK [Sulfuricurvum sp.]